MNDEDNFSFTVRIMKDMNFYNTSGAMYRPHQQGVPLQAPPQFHNSGSTINPPWYSGYHQGLPMTSPQDNGYCMQEEQMWPHSVFHQDFVPDISHHHGGLHHLHHYHHNHQQAHQFVKNESQLPSPQTTISGSDMSSPDAAGGSTSPNLQITNKPSPAATYEWVNKTAYQNQPTPGKTRTKDKYRVVYTDHQRVELEKEFYYSRYITIRRKSELANVLGLSERQVKIWFQNRRAKERKQVKKQEELTQKDTILMHQQHSLLPQSSVSAIM